MVGHQRPAGGHEMLGGSPLANAACDAPTASAASSLVNPFAISHQN
jgi:hypothetical protein